MRNFFKFLVRWIHEIVTEHLHYKKFCARWVPQMLTDEHKNKHVGAALMFLEGDTFLDQKVTGEETCVSHIIPETKLQSLE
jgi:hypothetical protein